MRCVGTAGTDVGTDNVLDVWSANLPWRNYRHHRSRQSAGLIDDTQIQIDRVCQPGSFIGDGVRAAAIKIIGGFTLGSLPPAMKVSSCADPTNFSMFL